MARAIYLNLESLIAARDRYPKIKAPVTLVYGDDDWSRPSDRQANISTVPGPRDIALSETGHFTSWTPGGRGAHPAWTTAPEPSRPARSKNLKRTVEER